MAQLLRVSFCFITDFPCIPTSSKNMILQQRLKNNSICRDDTISDYSNTTALLTALDRNDVEAGLLDNILVARVSVLMTSINNSINSSGQHCTLYCAFLYLLRKCIQ